MPSGNSKLYTSTSALSYSGSGLGSYCTENKGQRAEEEEEGCSQEIITGCMSPSQLSAAADPQTMSSWNSWGHAKGLYFRKLFLEKGITKNSSALGWMH